MDSRSFRRSCSVCVLLSLVLADQAKGSDKEPVLKTLEVRSGRLRAAIQLAGEAAMRQLSVPECQEVASEFTDRHGTRLSQNLNAQGMAMPAYLQTIWFSDGTQQSNRCKDDGIVAVTMPGSRVVLLCPDQFERAVLKDRRYGGAIIIHETLHTLGLGENPPTSKEITDRVLARCK